MSDGTMRLVDYSSSEESGDEVQMRQTAVTTHGKLPTLPSSFYDLYSVKPRIGDDPALHEGRIRGQPHVVGQWPSHVFIEFRPSPDLLGLLQSIVGRAVTLKSRIKSLLFTELGNVASLHVSLSRPLVLWTHEKDNFLQSFTSAIQSLKLGTLEFVISDIECFINHEATRKFLVLKLKNSSELQSLAEVVDNVVISFDRPRLYDDPVYHISIAWSDISCDMDREFLKALNSEFENHLAGIDIQVQQVKIKIGNEIHTIALT